MEKGEEKAEKSYKMDVFSLGVIIAELFLEKNIFNYSSLLDYKKGKNQKVIKEILAKIPIPSIRSLVYDMLKIDPEERIDIDDALMMFGNEIAPVTMTGFLLHFNAMVTSTEFWKSDCIIGHIYKNWIPIWKMIYGVDEKPNILYQNLGFSTVNKIILDDPFLVNNIRSIFRKNKDGIVYLDEYKRAFFPEKGNFIYEFGENDDEKKNIFNIKNNSDCSFIVINFLLQAMQNTKYESSNLVAMEMLKNFCYKLPDITKLQLVLPYFVGNLRRKSFTTKLTSIN